jgi:hypothetical protein
MELIRIVSPSYEIARRYADLNNIRYNRLQVISQHFDAQKLYGLRSVEVIVINQKACNPDVVDFLVAKAKLANLKLEYVNV